MLRLCFERIPGQGSIDTEDEFKSWLDRNIDFEYQWAGYIVADLQETRYGGTPQWNILTEVSVSDHFRALGWIMDGYVVHIYEQKALGEKSYKLYNGPRLV